jgi:hypothetical protein
MIGITWRPLHRYTNSDYGYKHSGYSELSCLTITTCLQACALEQELISRLKGRRKLGSFVAVNNNVAAGADGVDPWCHTPYFVYIAIKPHSNFYY